MQLADRIKTALDESRMLMLGAQILLGFQLQSPFQNSFERLDEREKLIELIALCSMVCVIGLLIVPTARHRIVEQGEATAELNHFITRIALITLLPFAGALALDVYIAGTRFASLGLSAFFGVFTFIVASAFWYGPFLFASKKQDTSMSTSDTKTPTAAKIDYVLTESRVVLPGAQAILGFQFVIVLTSGFIDLPPYLKWVHGAAIGFIIVTTILLMTPAAYHRIVHDGDAAPEFYEVASRLLLGATVFLALGLSTDIYLVASKIAGGGILPMVLAVASAALLLGLWHLWPLLLRNQRNRR